MTTEPNNAVLITGNKIAFARVLALRGALKLELLGMGRRGRSAYAIVKEEFGYKGNKQRVLDQINTFIDEHKEHYFNDHS